MANLNSGLAEAKKNKKDEFYTQLSDISNELRHYKSHFNNKVVLCNCDDPRVSNFFQYFALNFKDLGLKKLISVCYKNNDPDLFSQHIKKEGACYLEYYGEFQEDCMPDFSKVQVKYLKGNGDFRSEECINFLKEADIVVTNPPFSLFREYVDLLMKFNKKFLIVGHQNAITYKEIFPYIQNNQLWLGYGFKGGAAYFINNSYDNYAKAGQHVEGMIRVSGVVWFTNLPHSKRNEELILFKLYNKEEYPTYDNYNAIEINKTANIPMDYDGYMGVPITFLDKYNPNQFEIIWQASGNTRVCAPTEILKKLQYVPMKEDRGGCGLVNNKRVFSRIIIKRK